MSNALDRIRSTGSPWLFEFGLQLAEVTTCSKFSGTEAWGCLPDELVERLWAATVALCNAKEAMRLHTHGETAMAEALRRVAINSCPPALLEAVDGGIALGRNSVRSADSQQTRRAE